MKHHCPGWGPRVRMAVLLMAAWILPWHVSTSRAESAQVLPKGVSSASATYYHYFDITERYDPNGKVEDIDANYNANLNSTVFPALAPLDPFFPGVGASIGRSVVDFSFIYRWWEFGFNYGVTDRLSVGINVPYNWTENRVEATLDTSTANVGKNPALGIVPLAVPGAVPLTTEDVQSLLGAGLDVNGDGTVDVPGFGYKRFESFKGNGVGDIDLLAKYKFHEDSQWRLAFGAGARLPTGEVDDPDDLTDLGFGDGQTDLLFRFFGDYRLSDKWSLNATLRYDWQLEDHQTLRVPASANLPITANKENVERDLGDVFETELTGAYSFSREWAGSLTYRYTTKGKDKVSGSMGLAYSALEDETDIKSHVGLVGVTYSTIGKFRDGQARVPLLAGLSYRNRFAGENNSTKSEFVSLTLSIFF